MTVYPFPASLYSNTTLVKVKLAILFISPTKADIFKYNTC